MSVYTENRSATSDQLYDDTCKTNCDSVFSNFTCPISNDMCGYHGLCFKHVSDQATPWFTSGTMLLSYFRISRCLEVSISLCPSTFNKPLNRMSLFTTRWSSARCSFRFALGLCEANLHTISFYAQMLFERFSLILRASSKRGSSLVGTQSTDLIFCESLIHYVWRQILISHAPGGGPSALVLRKGYPRNVIASLESFYALEALFSSRH